MRPFTSGCKDRTGAACSMWTPNTHLREVGRIFIFMALTITSVIVTAPTRMTYLLCSSRVRTMATSGQGATPCNTTHLERVVTMQVCYRFFNLFLFICFRNVTLGAQMVGGRPNPVILPMLVVAMRQVLEWGVPRIEARYICAHARTRKNVSRYLIKRREHTGFGA